MRGGRFTDPCSSVATLLGVPEQDKWTKVPYAA